MRICFLSIDVESKEETNSFEGVEKMYRMLDIFKKYNANATLFVTGKVLEKYTELVKKWAKDYEIGCHGYYHETLDKLDLDARERQIKDYVGLYKKLFKKPLRGFRAPRNVIDNEQFPILEKYSFIYDSSVFSRYPWPVQRYEGYKGRAPVVPYYPNIKNYKKKGNLKIFEIPEAPITFWGLPLINVPLVGTWLRKWTSCIFKIIFFFRKPRYISFNMHSWDCLEKNYLKQLDKMLNHLKKIGYEFKSGEQIYEENR